jgi:PIN domain nuclease of toxin-antitoxin system
MIVLDTHVWVWWTHASEQLTGPQTGIIEANEADIIGVSAISVWEVAKLVQYRRLELPCSLHEWFDKALRYPGVRVLELTPEIAIGSTQLPGEFHRDPADQIIAATARFYDCPPVTSDRRLLRYTHVKTVA